VRLRDTFVTVRGGEIKAVLFGEKDAVPPENTIKPL
jgi:hypothetical protein